MEVDVLAERPGACSLMRLELRAEMEQLLDHRSLRGPEVKELSCRVDKLVAQ